MPLNKGPKDKGNQESQSKRHADSVGNEVNKNLEHGIDPARTHASIDMQLANDVYQWKKRPPFGTASTQCQRLTNFEPIFDKMGCHRDQVKVAAAAFHARCAGLSQLIHDLIVHHDLIALHGGLPNQSAIPTRFAFVANQCFLPRSLCKKDGVSDVVVQWSAHNFRHVRLIEDTAAATDEKDKGKFCRALTITANILKWTEQDLHTLHQKRLDPKVQNYSALEWWHAKIERKSSKL